MKKGKNSPERLLESIAKLDVVEFLGVCKVLNIDIYEKPDIEESDACAQPIENGQPRQFEDIWNDLCDKVEELNRERRRNLGALVRAALKGGK